ncbi:cysteine hydrolase [Candidatus Woesearchaeota archaeon]|nr:cysteine hydrolase [Candidatus Woesearchaeota archaeon]HIH37325.1 cysteine hydrolase [Candidatus Woesearchaeota archaeon]HIH48983.1 cysteine hydrolase [Candidatus Woesearchaeota archaeon]HIJ03058.1 cysteine hydrolase [Candidatus Woesearchaeota archaeon]
MKALIVMDFQNDIVHEKGKFAAWGIPAHVKEQQAIENTAKAIAKARGEGIKIIFVRVAFGEGHPELHQTKAGIYQGIAQAGTLVDGEWGAAFHESVQPGGMDTIITKHRINPFTNPQFLRAVDSCDELILAGVATNFVVEETAREAAAKNFKVTILEDCCASMGQESHDFTIKNILPNFAEIITSQEWAAKK